MAEEELFFPVVFILVWTIAVSIGFLLIKFHQQRKHHEKIIENLTAETRRTKAGDWNLITQLQEKLKQKNKDVKPEQYEGRWQDPDHPIISGEGGKGWQDPDHPIMR